MPTRDQADTRYNDSSIDQHGREWDTTFDKKTMKSCTPFAPMFKEPVPTPQKYVKHGKRIGTVVIDYDEWLADHGVRSSEVQQHLMLLASDMEPNRTAEAMERPTTSMLRILGANQLPIEFILAKMAGNKWVLGLSEKKPHWLTEELEHALVMHLGTRARAATALPHDLSRFRDDDEDEGEGEEDDERLSTFRDDEEPDELEELEEQTDPHATGGKRLPVGKQKAKRRKAAGAR